MEDALLVDLGELQVDVSLAEVVLRVLECFLRPFFVLCLVGQAADALDNQNDVDALLVHSDLQTRAIEYDFHNSR